MWKMGSYTIGRNFEIKCYKYLKKIFPTVIWLSEKGNSKLDFECVNNYGERIFGDAKHVKAEKSKPILRYDQKNADFVITNKGKEIILIFKKDFLSKISIAKYKPKIGKTYLIKEIDDKVWEDFINTIPRSMDINTAIIELLKKEGKKKCK